MSGVSMNTSGRQNQQNPLEGYMDALMKAHSEVVNEEPIAASLDLPPGVVGIAQLKMMQITPVKEGNNKGKPFFYARGVVVEPTYHENIPIRGCVTEQRQGIWEMPAIGNRKGATLSKAWNIVRSILAGFGIDPHDKELPKKVYAYCKYLQEQQPYFQFGTRRSNPTKEYPNPITFHSWGGVVKDYSPPDVRAEGVTDKSSSNDDDNNKPQQSDLPDDPTQLLEMIDDGSTEAEEKLIEIARSSGMTQEEIDAAEGWDDVVNTINTSSSQKSSPDDGDDNFVPEEKSFYNYKAPKSRKLLKVQVVGNVDEDAGTCDVKNTTTGKVFHSVPFDTLTEWKVSS